MKDLLAMSAEDLLAAVAAGTPAPAAGTAAALTGALAAALVGMVAKLTADRATNGPERLRERYGPYRARASELASAADHLRLELQSTAHDDAELIAALVDDRKPRERAGGSGEHGAPESLAQLTLQRSAVEPLRTARATLQVAEYAGELVAHGYRSAVGDAETALRLALTAAEAALAITAANLRDARLEPGWASRQGEACRLLADRLSLLRAGFPGHTPGA